MKKKRIGLIDEARGVLIILTVLFHAFYSMVMIYGYNELSGVFEAMLMWQPILPAGFVLLSGIAFQLSRSNIRRGLLLLAVAGAMMLAVWLVMPSQMIWFGIIHFLGTANLLFGGLKKYLDKIPSALGLIVFGVLFALSYNVKSGYFGLGGILSVPLPEFLFSPVAGVILGFPPRGFFSSDYIPMIPWSFLFLCGTILGRYVNRLPEALGKTHLRPLAFTGRHTLVIYLAHQPVIIGILELVSLLR